MAGGEGRQFMNWRFLYDRTVADQIANATLYIYVANTYLLRLHTRKLPIFRETIIDSDSETNTNNSVKTDIVIHIHFALL